MTHLKTDTEDKQYQSEVLDEGKNRRISGKTEMSGQNPHKQNESNPERNTKHFNFPQ